MDVRSQKLFARSWYNQYLTRCLIALSTSSSGIWRRHCKHIFPGQTTSKRLEFSSLPMFARWRSISTTPGLPNDGAFIRSKIFPSVRKLCFETCGERQRHQSKFRGGLSHAKGVLCERLLDIHWFRKGCRESGNRGKIVKSGSFKLIKFTSIAETS